MIHCINCGHVNAEGASHCEACYETLPAVTSCPTCQASVPDDAFFCPQCGASLPRGVANQGPPSSPDNPAESPAPPFGDLPPTNVVAQQSFGASPLPPTNVVHSGLDLPPTNVVNPLPETMPPRSPVDASGLPPTNVVNPVTQPPSEADSPSSQPTADAETERPDDIETVPTMVVSPSSDRNVVDAPLPPPLPESPLANPTPPPLVPPTMPPQAPPSYQTPVDPPVTGPPFPDEVSISASLENITPPETIPEPPTQTMPNDEPPDSENSDLSNSDSGNNAVSVPAATTVQPSMPVVGETVIQKPPARIIHERTSTAVTLPSNLDVILLGKMTNNVAPDVDVSGFMDSDVVSRRHAAIFAEPTGYFIEDLGSSNGTYVNDVPCVQGDRMPINPGDRICLGRENKVSFIFQIG